MLRLSPSFVAQVLFLAGGCIFTGADSLMSASLEDIANGKSLYEKACLLCHGEGGQGDGPAAFFIGSYSAPRPRNFTSGTFKFRSTPSGELPTDTDLLRTISNGIPGFMPPFGKLREQERREVLAYIKTFSEEFLRPSSPPLLLLPRTFRDTTASIEQGKNVYARLGCATCHGTEGKGDDHFFQSGNLTDRSGLPIPATDLTKPAAFKNGASPHDIARSILTGLDGTPMPSYLGSLSPDEKDLWHLVNYLLSLSQPFSPS